MSMLTEQCAKLRKTAYEVERIKNETIGMPTHDVLTLADTAMQLRHAADTIANLRNRLTDQTYYNQTCYNVARDREDLVCSVCGCYVENIGFDWSYCPRCGRRVVE